MAYLTNYQYITSVVPELEINDLYKESMDKFIKDNLQQSNAIKINNFGKRYQTHAQVLTNQESREEDENNEKKKKDELAYKHNKKITSDTKTEGNEMLMKIMVMTI